MPRTGMPYLSRRREQPAVVRQALHVEGAGQVLAPGGAGGVGWGPPAALAAQMLLGDRRSWGCALTAV